MPPEEQSNGSPERSGAPSREGLGGGGVELHMPPKMGGAGPKKKETEESNRQLGVRTLEMAEEKQRSGLR